MHTFELHIWGPAFGLPSIHPECIAAVALLRRVLQPEEWVVVPSHDTSLSPSKEFPLLCHAGKRISGFYAIVDYLHDVPVMRHIDNDLSPQQRADSTAFSTFIATSAQPLIDFSLYISLINYRSVTQPAYTTLLPWHLNYTIPPQHRAAAHVRTQHLGLSGLHVDTADVNPDGTAGSQNNGQHHSNSKNTISAQQNKGQSRPGPFSKQTIMSMIQTPQYAGRFRLEGLVTAFLAPLQEYLGEKKYLLGGDLATSLDCLAFGYLSLMYYPEMPMDWIRQIMSSKFGKVCRYVERMREELFGEEKFVVGDIMALSAMDRGRGDISEVRKRLGISLPWQAAPSCPPGPVALVATLARELTSRIPGLNGVSIRHGPYPGAHDVTEPMPTPFRKANKYLPLLSVAGGILSFIGHLAFQHFSDGTDGTRQSFYSSRAAKLSDMGEAGAALAALSQQMDYDAAFERRGMGVERPGDPLVEVDVEVGGDELV